MALFSARPEPRSRKSPARSSPMMVESLENRAYLSLADLAISVPGPLPATAIAGNAVHDKIAVNVANNGAGTASGRVVLTLFASLDQALDVGDAQIVQAPARIHIGTGANKTFNITVKKFPQNLNDNYFITAQVTGNGVTSTTGSSATTIAVTPPNVNLADQVTKVSASGHVTHSVNVNVLVMDVGNFKATGSLETALSVSASPDGSNPFSLGTLSKHINIKPGGQTTLHLRIKLPIGTPTGNQYIVANVDPARLFLDPDLTNNTAVSTTLISIT